MRGDGNGPPGDLAGLPDPARALPETRPKTVAALRMAIEFGTYVVDAAKVAQKMIDRIRNAGARGGMAGSAPEEGA